MKPHSAVVMLRPGRHYRRELFHAGLRRNGYTIVERPLSRPNVGDVAVLWNRFERDEKVARLYEQNGATVLIAENGYIGQDEQGQGLFALARSHHNGAGAWPVGGPERWEQMHVELAPWRKKGEFLLVLPQRGFGPPGIAMPNMWGHRIVPRLAAITTRPIRVRPHPGRDKTEPYRDFVGAWATVTWGSGAAIKAIAAGYPVFHEMPDWIGAPAARRVGKDTTVIENPFLGERLPMFQRLAWAQWSPVEIENGEAFAWLLSK